MTDGRQYPPGRAPQSSVPQQQAAVPSNLQSTSCSDITGTGGSSSGPSNCTTSARVRPNIQPQTGQARSTANAPSSPRVVVLPPPQCNMCDVLKTVGEVLPDLAEKLDRIKPETISNLELPLIDGGPNTLHPYLPRRPLPLVTEPKDPLDAINDMKEIASDAKALSDLAGKHKESEDYAEKCRNGFLDASWKAFTVKDGSYVQKAKAARDSLKECWKGAAKHIVEGILNSDGIDSDRSSGGK